jgi:anti-sigma-K factor RskA
MNCLGFPAEDYGLYVLGSLDAAQRDEIAEHLAANCPICEAEVAQYQVLWCAVGASAPPVNPSRKLRRRVIQSVGGTTRWWMMPLPSLAGAAALVLAVAGGWVWLERRAPVANIAFSPVYKVEISAPGAPPTAVLQTVVKEVPGASTERIIEKQVDNPAQAAAIAVLNQDLARERQRVTELSTNLAAAQRALSNSTRQPDNNKTIAALTARAQELERQVAQYRVLLEAERKRGDQNLLLASMMNDPDLRVIKLRATEKNQAVEGHAIIGGNAQMVFYASKLPALPINRVYQLWLIRSNGQAIVSAGIFTPDSANRGVVQLRDTRLLSGVTTVAVTDEPAGGSTQPTGHKWMVGS